MQRVQITPNLSFSRLVYGMRRLADDTDSSATHSNASLTQSFILPVMGSNNIERIKPVSHALSVQLDRQNWFEIYTAALTREVA